MKSRVIKLKKRGFVLLFATVLLLILLIIISNTFLSVTSYNLSFNNLPSSFKGFKIVQLSDLHSTEFGENNSELIRKISNLKPDIVLMTGDMISAKDESFSDFLKFARTIAGKFDTYFIVGNHEQALDDRKKELFLQSLESVGIRVADNEAVTLESGNEKINLYGLWFNLRFYVDKSKTENQYRLETQDLQKILGKSKEGFNLLITHNPSYFETYASWGADLVLAGHMHGGMVRIPFLGGVYSPEKEYFPKYASGQFIMDDSTMIVSRGLGNGNTGFRVLNPPEIVEITLS